MRYTRSPSWTLRVFVVGLVAIVGHLLIVAQPAAAAPIVNETAIMIQEGGTSEVMVEISGSNLSGVTATASDATVTVTPDIGGDGTSGLLRVSITGDQTCPNWNSCASTITFTGGAGNEGSDTITLYRVDAGFNPVVDFTASFSSPTRTTTTVDVAAGPTLSPPLLSGLWKFNNLVMKPVRTGEVGYDPQQGVCGDFPNDCVSVPLASFPPVETSGATRLVFSGLAAGTSYIPTVALSANFHWSNPDSANFDLRRGDATATVESISTAEAIARTLSLSDATVAATQSVTLAANLSAGTGTVRYSAANGSALCSLSDDALTVYTAGTCIVTATVSATGEYGPATTTATFTFTAVARTLTLAGLTRNVGQLVTLNATKSAGGGTTAYSVVNGTATGCSVSGTTLTTGSAGTCVVTASVPASGQYASATTEATFTFTGLTRTLTLTGGSSAADQSVTLAATVSAGEGTVTYTVANGTATGCSVSGTTLTTSSAGTCVVTASVPASGQYASATTSATFTFTAAAGETSTTTSTTTTTPVASTTTTPVASPTTTTIAPDRDDTGTLLELKPGVAGSVVNGKVEVVDKRTVGTAVELFSDEFSLNIGAKSANSEAVTPTADGRLIVAEDATVLVSGEGFEPGSQVEVWLFSDPKLLGVVEVASDGTFSATFALPAAVEIGGHTLQADGRTADGSTRTLNLGIEVVEDNPREADGLTMKGPDGTFYELEPDTAALLTDDDDDGVASVRDANYSVTDGEISVTTDSDLSLLIATSTASSATTTTKGSASIIFERGSELIARGTGYEPGVKVEVWIASTPRLLGIAVVGSRGEYELRIPVPADLPVGAHTIQSEGLASGGVPKAVSVGITVRRPAMLLPQTGWNSHLELAVLILVAGVMVGVIRRRAYSK